MAGPSRPMRSSAPLLLSLLSLPLGGCTPDLPLPEDATELDRAIVRRLEDEQVAGAQVAVWRDGDVVLERAYGWADPATRRPNEVDTRFLVASVSKLITAVAVMQQVEAGALALADPVEAHLPFGVRIPEHDASPTLRDLLTHTSGIRDNWSVLDDLYTVGDSELALEAFLAAYLTPGGELYDEANFYRTPPGARYRYSNVGFALLALVVERVDGRDFVEYSRQEIFEPAGMTHSAWRVDELPPESLAVPTEWRRGFDTFEHAGFPDYPSGSLRTTARDLLRFAGSLLGGDGALLSDATFRTMIAPAIPEVDREQGLGFYGFRVAGERVVGHDGGERGASAELVLRPERGDAAAVLVNGDLAPSAFRSIEERILAGR